MYFNPRSRVGNDLFRQNIHQCMHKFQSTFPRGERRQQLFNIHGFNSHFNPRSRVGNDTEVSLYQEQPELFQSTFPRGERRVLQSHQSHQIIFQSTFPRGERRFVLVLPTIFIAISIHVPAWGTTWYHGLGWTLC